jgi:hypothetical protein
MNVAPDGSVVVRLSAAPWLVRHEADGKPSVLSVDIALDWVTQFVTGDDGSLYLAGTVDVPDAPRAVRIVHLSPSGTTLGSALWGLPREVGAEGQDEAAQLGGLARDDAGTIWAVATAEFGRFVGVVDSDLQLQARVEVPQLVDELDQPRDVVAPARLAFAAEGQYLLQGGSRALWVQRGDGLLADRGGWWLEQAANPSEDAVHAGGVLHAPSSGWFVAVGTGFTDTDAGGGFYHRGVVRLSEDGRRVWGNGDYFEPQTAPVDQAELRHVSLALLDDSVLLATLLPNGTPRNADDISLSPAHPLATVIRYSQRGEYAAALELGAVLDVKTVAPEAALFLEPDDLGYRLQRFDFEPLELLPLDAGAPCSVPSDCASSACCASATGLFPVTCSARGQCSLGAYCEQGDRTCDGTCVDGELPATQGYCAPACVTSDDCPTRSACVNGSCSPTCQTDADCPYRGAHCLPMGAELVCVTGS